ncbi:MAG: M20 family metallopeptidase [Bacteroidota bacterium]
MNKVDVIELTRKLISFNTVSLPGNEGIAAKYVGEILLANGFGIKYHPFKGDKSRLSLIAEKGIKEGQPPIIFTGHFDTVPVGKSDWGTDPFKAEIIGDKMYGRGSTDMKAGVAAIVSAAIEAFNENDNAHGVRLILTASEELGCEGAADLVSSVDYLGDASAIIVGEPTSNIPAIAHKSSLYLEASATGKTAHSSMPHLGDNAIYKVARAISKIEKFDFGVEEDELLGYPTINVGVVEGGQNLNSVPDKAGFTIDIRSTSKLDNTEALNMLKKELGDEIDLKVIVNNSSVYNYTESDFEKLVYKLCGMSGSCPDRRKALPYMTDGSALQTFYKGIPTIIMGPGEAKQAHKTNEFCYVSNIHEAVEIYKNIIIQY